MVAAGAGSSAMINAALDIVIAPGDHMVIPSPTFLLYRGAAMLRGAELHQIPTRAVDDFALPVDDLIVCARTNEAKLIALCAPNNPTGTVYALDDLRSLADESAALLLIDEAYGEFCGQDLRPLLTEFENVVILRTFSKAYALAGQRIGYALGHPEVIAAIDRVNIPFPVSTFSATAAMVALENSERFLANTAAIVAEREAAEQGAERAAGTARLSFRRTSCSSSSTGRRRRSWRRCATNAISSSPTWPAIPNSRTACASPSARPRRTPGCWMPLRRFRFPADDNHKLAPGLDAVKARVEFAEAAARNLLMQLGQLAQDRSGAIPIDLQRIGQE